MEKIMGKVEKKTVFLLAIMVAIPLLIIFWLFSDTLNDYLRYHFGESKRIDSQDIGKYTKNLDEYERIVFDHYFKEHNLFSGDYYYVPTNMPYGISEINDEEFILDLSLSYSYDNDKEIAERLIKRYKLDSNGKTAEKLRCYARAGEPPKTFSDTVFFTNKGP